MASEAEKSVAVLDDVGIIGYIYSFAKKVALHSIVLVGVFHLFVFAGGCCWYCFRSRLF